MEKGWRRGCPTRWSTGTKGRRRRVGAKSSSFFFNFFPVFTLFPTLFSDSNSEFSKQIRIGIDLQERFLYLCFFFSFGFGFGSADLSCCAWDRSWCWRCLTRLSWVCVYGYCLWCSIGLDFEIGLGFFGIDCVGLFLVVLVLVVVWWICVVACEFLDCRFHIYSVDFRLVFVWKM